MILGFKLRYLRAAAAQRAPRTLPVMIALSLALTHSARAQAGDTTSARAAKTADLGPFKTVEFDTDEGTWMNLDLSPDGRTIMFDLLGDIYTVPVAGGDAKLLLGGRAWERQARYSPDGKLIAFSSDRDGAANIWVANADGSNPRQLTKETVGPVSQPAWTPDGNYIVFRKNAQTPNWYYAAELWMVHKNGGAGLKLTETSRYNYPHDPAVSPSGRTIYFGMAGAGGRGGGTIVALDRQTGEFSTVSTRPGGTPVLSPDGKWMVFVHRADARTQLVLHDMSTNAERVLVPSINQDESENFLPPQGRYPTMAFTRDSRELLYTTGGKIHMLTVPDGQDRVIPFRAHVKLDVAQPIAVQNRVQDGEMNVRMLRWPSLTADQRKLTFSALGKVYVMDFPNGTPRRLTTSEDFEYSPSFSPDGQSIAYTTWNDVDGGTLKVISASGGAPRTLTRKPGHYLNPSWSPDGRRIVFLGTSNVELRGGQAETETRHEFLWLSADGSDTAHVITTASPPRQQLRAHPEPVFGPNGDRIYYAIQENAPGGDAATNAGPQNILMSVRLDGLDKVRHIRFANVDQILPSPDGQQLAVVRQANVWLMAMPPYATTLLDFNFQAPQLPARQLTKEGGQYLGWLGSRMLYWSFANKLYRQATDSGAPIDSTTIRLTAPRAAPNGTAAFTNARLITMNGDEVIPKGTIVVENNRISAVGPSGRVTIPRGARVFDASGKTIMPGLIDAHAHLFYHAYELYPKQRWEMISNLAYGTTTSYDPSAPSFDVFPQAEMVEAGALTSPRILSSGDVIYGGPIPGVFMPIATIADARSIVSRYKNWGAIMLKQYLQGTRIKRQLLAQAAREAGVRITAEGGADMYLDLTMMVDGYTAFEHNLPIVPLYKDVLQLFAQTGVYYTPTLIVSYGGPSSEDYFFALDNRHDDPKLRRFVPEDVIESHRRRPVIPEDEYQWRKVSQAAADITKAGGRVTLGAHGQLQGFGTQWELWALHAGGLTPMQALREGTLTGAQKLGLEHDLGSLEAGKLADFLVLDKNPLEDIHNSSSIRYTVKNGFVFDAESMNEVWPEAKALGKFYWQSEEDRGRYAPKPRPKQ